MVGGLAPAAESPLPALFSEIGAGGRRPARGRRLAGPALALGLAACGGGDDGGDGGVVPPPPPSSAPSAISLVSGGGQQAFAGAELPDSVVVRVSDAQGRPFPGAAVRFSATQGGGSAAPATQATDAAGHAATRWRIGRGDGEQTLTASVDQLTVSVSAASAGDSVCSRSPAASAALARAASRDDCGSVTAADLAGLVSLNMAGPDAQSSPGNEPVVSSLEAGDFRGLTRLRDLTLAGNRLSELPPGVFSGMPELGVLDLSGNLLARVAPESFAGLSQLSLLVLGFNPLAELPPGLLAQLPSLSTLDLGLGRLRSLRPEALRGAPGLAALLLTGNQIAEWPAGVFDSVPNLRQIDLSRNGISSLPAEVFRGLSRLEELYLGGNRLEAVPEGLFGDLSALQRLGLDGNRLESVPPDVFAGLERLVDVGLGGNLLDALPDGLFEGLPQLEELSLSPNPGAPFSLVVELERVDSQDPLAPGPAQVAAKVAQGAPFPMSVSLRAVGGSAASGSVVVPAGAVASATVEIANAPGSSLSVSAAVPGVPSATCPGGNPCFAGLATEAGPALVLANPPSATTTVPALHLIQSVQDERGGVPLIAGRRALLRVFVRSDSANAFRPSGRATFFLRGAAVHTATLEPPQRGIPTALRQDRLGASFNAAIPGSALQPGVEMVVEIDPDNRLPLTARSVRRIPAAGRTALDVREVAPLDLTIVPVQYGWAANQAVNAKVLELARGLGRDGAPAMRFARALLPARRVEVTVRDPYFTWADTTSRGAPALLDEIEALRHLEAGGADKHYHGVFAGPRLVRPGAFWDVLGIALQPGRSAVTLSHELDGSLQFAFAEVLAHEIGHNLNLGHAPCGVGTAVDEDFPHEDGSTGLWGYDFGAAGGPGRLLDPAKARDIMSYCLPAWVSGYSFVKALRYRTGGAGGGGPAPGIGSDARGGRAHPGRVGRMLILWGGVREGKLALEPAFEWDATPKMPARPGPYRLTAWDEAGREMLSLAFEAERTSAGGRSFLFAIPFAGEWPGVPARTVLSGPEGFAASDRAASQRMAVLVDRASGRIRGIARDWPEARRAGLAASRQWEARLGARDP